MYTLLCMCVYLVIQSCPTLCDPVDCAPGSFIHGILQVRILEWVAITFSRESTQPRDRTLVSCTASKFFTVRATREANNTHKGGSVIKKKKNLSDNAGDVGLIPGSGKSPRGGNGNPLQYSCWEIPRTEGLGRLQSMRSQRVRHD